MSWTYGVKIEVDDAGDFVVSVRDLPEAQTSGDTGEEAIALAADAIGVAVGARIDHEEDLADPSPVAPGEIAISLSLRLSAKATLYRLWRNSGVTRLELARRMGRTENEARRILDPYHAAKLDDIEAVARALGARLAIEVAPAPTREFTAAAE